MRFLNHKSVPIFFCCLLVLAKFALVAHNEIVSIQDDSFVYGMQSLGPWVLGYPPGYPIWLSICQIFNIPQRLAIEGLYLFAVLLVSYAGRRCFGLIAGYALFVSLSFAPATYFLFDLGLTDGFYTCLSLLALAIMMLLFTAKTFSGMLVLSVELGGLLGVMAITRNEDPLLAFWLFLSTCACAIVWRDKRFSILDWSVWRKPLLASAVATVAAVTVVVAVCSSYYFSQGVFARGVALIPGHTLLLKNLAQIQTSQPQIRFVPISKKSRELAYAVSPTFAKLGPAIEDPKDSWQVISRQFGTPDGEIGGGWIWHSINLKILARAGGQPALAEAEYRKINSELKAAFGDGRLRRRFIIHPLIGGDLAGLLKELPASISAVTASAFSAQPNSAVDQGFQGELFDKAFGRRAALVPRKSGDVIVQGWAFVNKPGRKIASVVVGSDQTSSAPILSQNRPDVVEVFGKQNGWRPEVIGFHANLSGSSPEAVKITYVLPDGASLQADHLKAMQVSRIESSAAPVTEIIQGIDIVGMPSSEGVDPRHSLAQSLLTHLQARILLQTGLAALGLAMLVIGYALLRRRDARYEIYAAFFGVTLALWIGRVLFYSLIDARAWSGNQIRYLAPANVLGLAMFSVAIGTLAVFAVGDRFLKQDEKAHSTNFSHI